MNDTQHAGHSDTATDQLGAVGILDDGRKYVVLQRHLAHSIENVWTAITDPNHLADWFPGMKLECRQGGTFEIWFGEGCEGGPPHVSGTVSRFEPPHVLECGSMRYELEADGDGCILTFTDILHFQPPRADHEIVNSVLGGWHKYLDVLEFSLQGGSSDPRDFPEFDYTSVEVDGRD